MVETVQEEMLLKDFSIFSFGGHFVQRSRTIRAILVEHGEHSCETIINLDQYFRRCHLKKKLTDNA